MSTRIALAALLAPLLALAQGDPGAAARAAMQAGDYAEAYCLWKGLAERGDPDAQYNIGWLYHNGYGLAINDRAAVAWWEKAAARGHADALFALGNLYRLGGREIPVDRARAAGYFLQAAQKGDDDALLLLRTLLAGNDAALRATAVELMARHGGILGAPLRVTSDRANFRGGPGTGYGVIEVLPGGSALIEFDRKGRWVQAAAPASGRVGWLHDSLLGPP